jgi:two-component system nitrate/nitrite sensor histidine kinase NarX
MLDELESVEADQGIVNIAINSLWPVPVEDLAKEDPSQVGVSPAMSGFRSVVCIPLVSGQEAIGTMELGSKTQYSWNLDELRWLALVGRIIGSIAHRVSLTEHLRDFAALQERSRLAQELHDGFVQVIGSIRLWSEEARESLESKEYTSAQQAVTRIESLSSDAYASLRDELLGLRDTLDSNRDLPSVIKEYLSRFKRQWGIETRMEVDESEGAKTNLAISPATEIQLLRIFQEALTNTRRHAEATKVDVCLSADNDHLRITIQDNGRGFYPDKVGGDHLGINIMRERAASVQGNIKLESEPGLGTKIQIELPRQQIGIDARRAE